MQIHVIACRVMTREISLVAAQSEHPLHIHYLEQGLHDTPDKLRDMLQAEIDAIDSAAEVDDPGARKRPCDAIVLAYGLCSNAICGLRSRRSPLVAPRAHDCIALILGSRERYDRYFEDHPGTYWYTPGWIEQTPMPGKERVEEVRKAYVAKYGEENADYLMDMEQEWLRKYDRCAYVAWPELHRDEYRSVARESAAFLEWGFEELPGDQGLMARLLNGEWDEDDILVVPPGETIGPSYDRRVIQSAD